jgi:hypothetical protein
LGVEKDNRYETQHRKKWSSIFNPALFPGIAGWELGHRFSLL